jgi:hypothetical protein
MLVGGMGVVGCPREATCGRFFVVVRRLLEIAACYTALCWRRLSL